MNREICRSVARLVGVLGLLLLGGCDSGGSSPTEPQRGISFTPDRSAGSNSITLRSAGGTRDTLELEVFATGVTNLHSLAMQVSYPTNLVRFSGYREGDFLGASVPVVITVLDTVVITQFRVLPQGVSGNGRIGTLTFSAVAAGTGRIDFIQPEAIDPTGQDLPGVDWIGGRVQVVL